MLRDDASAALLYAQNESFLLRHRISAWDAMALVTCCLLLVAFAPPLMFDGWTPRMALLLSVGPPGLYVLIVLCRSRDSAAVLLATALLWTILAAVASDAPRSALLGFVGRDSSALTVVLSSGLWAAGRRTTERGRALLVPVFVGSATFSAVVGSLQVIVGVTEGPLALLSGRPTGFATNPVYFGAVTAAGLALTAERCSDGRWRSYLPSLVALGVATSLSGSRVALAAAVFTGLVLLGARRDRPGAVAVGAIVASLATGVMLDRTVGAGRNAADRLAAGGGGRISVWKYGIEAWIDEPISGYGFGRFRPAVQGRFSTSFVRDHAADEISQPWFDPHNLAIGLLVAVGLVGVMLFGAWAIVWARAVGGPLVWALIPIVVHWMLQPLSLFTLPLAMLIFGAAHGASEFAVARPSRATATLLGVAGLLFGATLLIADVALRRAADRLDGDQAAGIATLFVSDPIVDDVVAQIYTHDATEPDREATVLRWRQQIANGEPDRPHWWSALAQHQIDAGLYKQAEVSLNRAYALQRHNPRTTAVEARLAVALNDRLRLRDALDRLCVVSPGSCDLSVSDLIGTEP